MARTTHPQVSYHVDCPNRGEMVYKTWDDAAAAAVTIAAGNGDPVNLDVCIGSEAGARWYGGDDAVEAYREDPDASVSERYEIRVNAVGRVP